MNGLLILHKPVGPTSHDIVFKVRKWSRERRVGHTGTLDPLASGVLVLCLGTATRLSEYLVGADKRYTATIRLGEATHSYDSQSDVVQSLPVNVTFDHIVRALQSFHGTIQQMPPAYSAVQIKGKRAYAMARRGQTPQLQPREVTIHQIQVVAWQSPVLTLDVHCSSGTYIRSLAHDLGQALGCGGHITALCRTAVADYQLTDAHTLDEIERAFATQQHRNIVRPAADALSHWRQIYFNADEAHRLQHGNPTPFGPAEGDPIEADCMGLAFEPKGQLVAIVQADIATQEWKPKKVLLPAWSTPARSTN